MIGTARRLGVVDGLHRLRHDTVVGGDDQDHDVGGLGAARAHGREGLVTRRVEEGHLPVRRVYLISANVLGDAAELPFRHLGRTDCVEERRLAVVDVPHDRHHRRPRTALAGVRFLLLQDLALERADLEIEVELVRDQPRGGRDRAPR